MCERKQRPVGSDKSSLVAELPKACADEGTAVELVERLRWGDEPCCPKCGGLDVYRMTGRDGKRNARWLWRCRDCGGQYTVRFDTILAQSKVPMHQWVLAFWMLASSKKSMSSLQLKRLTGLNYRSALFLTHRIRWAMAEDGSAPPLSGIVEADETYCGGRPRYKIGHPKRTAYSTKTPVAAAVQRGGDVRAKVIATVTSENLDRFLRAHVDPESVLMTDDLKAYRTIGRRFARHGFTRHTYGEYVKRHDRTIHSNTIESYFAIVRRSLNGVFHNVSPEHLFRYIDEAAYKWNTRSLDDGARTERLIRQAIGRRLTYAEATFKENDKAA